MHLDVLDMRAFYYRTKLGRATKQTLQAVLVDLWPDVAGQTVVGFGFAAPLLRPFLDTARRVICLMPSQQGVMPWPKSGGNASCLVEETTWPVEAGTIDRLVVAHGLETCERPDALLAEIWRVLSPGGSVVFIVPNRAGLWSRRDATPFGYGRPYSARQLDAQLRKHKFLTDARASALYGPPSERRFWLRTAGLWERMGKRLGSQLMAGALIVEASKQVYVMPRGGTPEAIKGPLEVLEGLAGGKRRPVGQRLTGTPD